MLPTALEFQLIKWKKTYGSDPIHLDELCESEIAEYMIEFAQMHVQAAIKAAAENASAYVSTDNEPTVSKGSIFCAYRLTNIK